MSDDLSQFFAKKAQKSKDKKKKGGIIKIEDVCNQLERKSRLQEQEDLEEQEREQLELADDRFLRSQENEDSEWLEFSDTKNRLADVRVRDMDFSEQIEEEIGEEKSAAEHIKTWNINSEPKEDANDENLIKQVVPTEPKKFVPSVMKRQMGQKKAALDLNNEEMFPSIANADKIAKELEEKKKQEEEKKKAGAYQKEESFIEAPAPRQERPRFNEAREREPVRDRDGFTEVRRKEPPAESRADMADTWRNKPATTVQRPPMERRPVEVPPKEDKPAAPKAGSYVPPHLRNRAS